MGGLRSGVDKSKKDWNSTSVCVCVCIWGGSLDAHRLIRLLVSGSGHHPRPGATQE